jgi:hypothetical protein
MADAPYDPGKEARDRFCNELQDRIADHIGVVPGGSASLTNYG